MLSTYSYRLLGSKSFGGSQVGPGGSGGDPYFSDVSLLLHGNGTNGSTTFVDSSSFAHTFTVSGNAQISTTQSKFGGASMSFDGTGDGIQISGSSSQFTLGTGDFTCEAWVYLNVLSPTSTIFSFNGNDFRLFANTAALWFLFSSSAIFNATSKFTTGVWNHVAVTRQSGTVYAFFNGELLTSVSNSSSGASTTLQIGKEGAGNYLNGYIDDLRITKGVARYTSTFSVPTEPYPDM